MTNERQVRIWLRYSSSAELDRVQDILIPFHPDCTVTTGYKL